MSEPHTCGNCRYWSDLLARAVGGKDLEAMCVSATGKSERWTKETDTCSYWVSVWAPPTPKSNTTKGKL